MRQDLRGGDAEGYSDTTTALNVKIFAEADGCGGAAASLQTEGTKGSRPGGVSLPSDVACREAVTEAATEAVTVAVADEAETAAAPPTTEELEGEQLQRRRTAAQRLTPPAAVGAAAAAVVPRRSRRGLGHEIERDGCSLRRDLSVSAIGYAINPFMLAAANDIASEVLDY